MTFSRRALLTAVLAHLAPRKAPPVAFTNEITGGQGALVRPAIKSPNFRTGVQGWTINRDGSAEFNNLTIRGTFNGANFVINSSGEFFYSGTPAPGNLIASIANAGGTDTHGNTYVQGIASYANPVWSALRGGNVEVGPFKAGAPDTTNIGGIQDNGTGSTAYKSTVAGGSFNDAVVMTMVSGQGGQATGGANNPHVQFADSLGTSALDLSTSGSWINLRAFAGAANQTPFALDTPAAQTSDLMVLKSNGTAKFNVSAAGNISNVGTITPLVTGHAQDLTSSTTTSTSYAASTNALAATAVLPASGKALVTFIVRCMNSVAGDNTLSDVLITGSTSGTIHAVSDTTAIQWNQTTSAGPFITRQLITGVAGETITATAQHRVTAGTGTFLFRDILIETKPV